MNSLAISPKTRYRPIKYKLGRIKNFSVYQLQTKPSIGIDPRYSTPSRQRWRQAFNSKRLKTLSNAEKNNEEDDHQTVSYKKYGKSKYIESLNNILALEKRRQSQKVKTEVTQEKYEEKVILPTLSESQSMFSTLTKMHEPINYIKNSIHNCEEELKKDDTQINKLRFSFKAIEKRINGELNLMKSQSAKSFERLRKLLNQSLVFQQSVVVNAKQSISSLQEQMQKTVETIEKYKNKTIELQIVVFSSSPYELEAKQDSHMLKYF